MVRENRREARRRGGFVATARAVALAKTPPLQCADVPSWQNRRAGRQGGESERRFSGSPESAREARWCCREPSATWCPDEFPKGIGISPLPARPNHV